MRILALHLATPLFAAEHKIKPGDDPQAVMDAGAPGDKLTFLPGLHQLGIDREKLTYRFGGRDFRLTDAHGKVVREIIP